MHLFNKKTKLLPSNNDFKPLRDLPGLSADMQRRLLYEQIATTTSLVDKELHKNRTYIYLVNTQISATTNANYTEYTRVPRPTPDDNVDRGMKWADSVSGPSHEQTQINREELARHAKNSTLIHIDEAWTSLDTVRSRWNIP